MPHPAIENRTGFCLEPLFPSDESGRTMLVPVVKATYAIGMEGDLVLAEKQVPMNLEGEFYDRPGESSYKYEPECSFTKLSTDVVLIGHAYAPYAGASEVMVSVRLGPVHKTVKITGDRYWIKTLGTVSMTSPEPFERIPLTYERAFGGWDRSHSDPNEHVFEPCNPVGTGFRSKRRTFEDGIRLPNLEDPKNLIRSYGDSPSPAAFGFTSPDWQPRAKFAGTYDESWTKERMPLLPKDFDRRFFNGASPGLIAPGYLRGDEAVSIENASSRGTIVFNLPGLPPPKCQVRLAGRLEVPVQMNLDTVIINTDEDLLLLLWRGHLALRNGPHDVASIQMSADGVSAMAAVE